MVTLRWHIRSTSTLCSATSDCHFRIIQYSSTCSDGPSTCIGLKFPALHPNRIQRKPESDQYGQLRPGNTEGWISLHRTETFLCFSSSPLAPQQALQNPSLACFHWKLPLAPQQTAKPPHSRWVYEFCEDFSSLNSILQFQNSFY